MQMCSQAGMSEIMPPVLRHRVWAGELGRRDPPDFVTSFILSQLSLIQVLSREESRPRVFWTVSLKPEEEEAYFALPPHT